MATQVRLVCKTIFYKNQLYKYKYIPVRSKKYMYYYVDVILNRDAPDTVFAGYPAGRISG
jgi:hypothetical protein